MGKTKESAQVAQEQEETKTEETSEELKNASESADETSGESAEQKVESQGEEKKEAEGEEGKKEEVEETFEEKLDRLAQSKSDKSLKTYHTKIDGLTKELNTVKAELNDKVWNRELQDLFGEEKESLGEDEANKRKANREKIAAQVKEFQQKSTEVEQVKAKIGNANLDELLRDLKVTTLEKGVDMLTANLRDYRAKMDVWALMFPEDKAKIQKVAALVKKFEKAQDLEDYDIILEGIKESVKTKPFVPDTSRSGGGGVDLSKLSPREKIDRGIESAKKLKKN